MNHEREEGLEGERNQKEGGSLFQPDTILADQYFGELRRKAHLDPEKALMLAVLEDAITCFQSHLLAKDRKGQAIFQEAEEWIWERDGDWPFSFESICEALDLNPEYLRKGLLCWKEKQLGAKPKAKVYPMSPQEKPRQPGAQQDKEPAHKFRRAAGG